MKRGYEILVEIRRHELGATGGALRRMVSGISLSIGLMCGSMSKKMRNAFADTKERDPDASMLDIANNESMDIIEWDKVYVLVDSDHGESHGSMARKSDHEEEWFHGYH